MRNHQEIIEDGKGMTLVEVLVTLAVLSIMAIPIFDTFLTSMEINHDTMSTVSANHIGQQLLERLKSNKVLVADDFSDNASFDHSLGTPDTFAEQYKGVHEGYDVIVTLTALDNLDYKPDSSTEVNLGNQIDQNTADVKVTYQKTEDDGNFFLFESDSTKVNSLWSKVVFSDSGTSVKAELFQMRDDGGGTWTPVAKALSKTFSPTADNKVAIAIAMIGEPDKGRIDVENQSTADVLVYEIDDRTSSLRVVPKARGNKGEIHLYRNIRSTGAGTDNELLVYEVDVQVSKNSKTLERLVGTVMK